MPFYVYMLACADKSLYTGYTNDLKRRIKQHNGSKQGARYTKTRRPVTLKYSERYKTIGEALRREAEIKHWPRKKKLELIKAKVRRKIQAKK